nr:zf-BED domain-containing protein [Tanacetum cinerariifolium]
MSYEECEKIYVEAVIFINQSLARLVDVTVKQWLDLKYGNHMTMDENVKKGLISTWLIRSYKLQFKEYLEIKKQRDTCARDVNMEHDPSNLVFAKCLASKFYNHLDMDWYTKNALWIYWARSDDEVEVFDEESSYPDDENLTDKNEVAEFFKIETNMSLQKILMDLELTKNIRMTGYISGMKTCHGYMKNHGQTMEYGRNPLVLNIVVNHSYSIMDILSGQFVVGKMTDIAMAETFMKHLKLGTHSDIKICSDGMINEEEESLDETWRKWDEYENTTHDHDESDVYNDEEHEDEERRKDTAHNAPVCKIKRFEMISYSFGQDEEYVAIKECECDDLTKTNEDACRAYQKIFRSMDEGWVVTRAE